MQEVHLALQAIEGLPLLLADVHTLPFWVGTQEKLLIDQRLACSGRVSQLHVSPEPQQPGHLISGPSQRVVQGSPMIWPVLTV